MGNIIHGDCIEIISQLEGKFDLIFADPPFNLGRKYGKKCNDDYDDYMKWCKEWIQHCAWKLSDGGVFIVHNIPKNAFRIATVMEDAGLRFQNWVAWKTSNYPVSNRMLPEHFPYLVFSNGKLRVWNRWGDTVPHARCRHCDGLLADWGGHAKNMNPAGKRVSDVWTDIHRIRHKSKKSRAHNELPVLIAERFIKLYTNPGDRILDPFLGSGTTAVAAQGLGRRWVGVEIELENVEIAAQRLADIAT